MSHFENLKHIQTSHAHCTVFGLQCHVHISKLEWSCTLSMQRQRWAKVLYPKYYKIFKWILYFCYFWADWAVRALLKISAGLLKYPFFEGIFLYFVCQSMSIFLKVLGIYNFEMSSRPLAANEACQYHIWWWQEIMAISI